MSGIRENERRLLALDEPLPDVEPLADGELPEAVEEVRRAIGDTAPAGSPHEARRRLTEVLTQLRPGEIPASTWPLLDGIWATEARAADVTDIGSLSTLSTSRGRRTWRHRSALWRGDITRLGSAAVVNAANSGLTGCYIPWHSCVDNAIHTVAGPHLREDCGRVVALRGHPEPAGTATATRGWFLPARYVIHTVGPIVADRSPTEADANLLRACYVSCLEAASELKAARSIAFCSISTGVFGYPVADAARVATGAVARWLDENPEAIDLVIFVVFSSRDEAVYREVLALDGDTAK